MSAPRLGTLEKVDLRSEWPNEATAFTPWLAQEENLALLGDAIGLDLELEAAERSVGPFRADILCKDIGRDSWVLIENQLERTDHTHLGQILTYAAGVKAATMIWIAAKFTNEHRAALDWLNDVTDDTFAFFGVEVELWRIGDSLAAPKFSIVSKPNTWSRAVKAAARGIDEAALTEWQVMQRDYWDAFHKLASKEDTPIPFERTAQPQSWMGYSSGKSAVSFNCAMNRFDKVLRAEIYFSGSQAQNYYRQVLEQKEQIETELGCALIWPSDQPKRDRKVFLSLRVEDFQDKSDWSNQHAWLLSTLNAYSRVLSPRLRKLEDMSPSTD